MAFKFLATATIAILLVSTNFCKHNSCKGEEIPGKQQQGDLAGEELRKSVALAQLAADYQSQQERLTAADEIERNLVMMRTPSYRANIMATNTISESMLPEPTNLEADRRAAAAAAVLRNNLILLRNLMRSSKGIGEFGDGRKYYGGDNLKRHPSYRQCFFNPITCF